MKNFILHDLRLLSRREKTARTIRFHPKVTIIRGINDTGKSSVIKSIYWCFGAEPAVANDIWTGLDICGAVTFTVDGVAYQIVRHGRQFGLFNAAGQRVQAFSSVTRELAPYLAGLFDFGLLLNDREGNPATPPPAYYLLPFYIDQDKGWSETWSSFAGLQQFRDWRKDVAEYHVGLFPNNYYRIKTEIRQLRASLDEPRRQEKSLAMASEQVSKRLVKFSVDFNIERFRGEVDELIKEAEGLAEEEEVYRRRVGDLANQRAFVVGQIEIARRTLAEISKDYEYAIRLPERVECPTCGADYSNSISERFGLALDEDQCNTLLGDLQRERAVLDGKLTEVHRELDGIREKHSRVWGILEAKREAVNLHQIIANEARGEAVQAISDQVDQVRAQIGVTEERISGAQDSLKSFEDKARTKKFREEFYLLLDRFAVNLRVSVPKASRFDPKIRETGSDLPRAILAYDFAVLHMIWRHGSAARAPIVIDSPNQQDQDLENLKVMLSFVKDMQPEGSQLVLGLVDPQGVNFDGIDYEFTAKRQVLSTDEYATTGAELQRLVTRIYDE